MASVEKTCLNEDAAITHYERALAIQPDYALIDGNRCPVLPCPCEPVVKGDSKVAAISAASILAKVSRDRLMASLHEAFPDYGWSGNKGYGTRDHVEALDRHGAGGCCKA